MEKFPLDSNKNFHFRILRPLIAAWKMKNSGKLAEENAGKLCKRRYWNVRLNLETHCTM